MLVQIHEQWNVYANEKQQNDAFSICGNKCNKKRNAKVNENIKYLKTKHNRVLWTNTHIKCSGMQAEERHEEDVKKRNDHRYRKSNLNAVRPKKKVDLQVLKHTHIKNLTQIQ